jgi:hypothetical protein
MSETDDESTFSDDSTRGREWKPCRFLLMIILVRQ